MKSDKLQDAIGEVKDEYIADAHPEAAAQQKKNRRIVWVAAAAALALVCGLGIYALVGGRNAGESVKPGFATLEEPNVKPSKPEKQPDTPENVQGADDPEQEEIVLPEPQEIELREGPTASGEAPARQVLLSFTSPAHPVTASLPQYSVSADLSSLMNLNQFGGLSDEAKQKLAQNLFVVTGRYGNEFFELYEDNRYFQIPNFVTVDSLMHTYHLYFSLLLNRTEKNELAPKLAELSRAMLAASEKQYEQLKGTQWKDAALRNVVFFSVAASLQEPLIQLPDYAADMAAQECSAIYAASGIDISELTGDFLDYSQFKPRGYYEGDETLERYFRAMMWYGQINFTQKNDSLNRSALLMTLAMLDTDFDTWEKIYTVTSFFAGASDDLGYYEYEPAIEEAYGGIPGAYTLATDEKAYARFVELVGQMDPPAINSIPVWEGTEDIPELKKGFRFMGQRFTIDASVMQQLVYSAVDENSSGEKRLLPDTLDMPAALGSDTALDLLTRQGETDYPGYSENMAQLRQSIRNAPEGLWSASLYASWLYTLNPLLEGKGAGYPSFMRSSEWQKKSLESYAGSFTELKHDTVLYSKQVMAEMGGGPQEKIDDRGYVEPETEVYRRFQELAQQTMDGLEGYGMLSADEKENLSRLEELAASLLTISEKELRGEVLTDEEYELIRAYGGTLEHLWDEAVKDKADSEWYGTQEMPSALVTDIATDPNGRVLQIATGRPSVIYVIVPVDGTLRLASGTVFDFYQFEQPLSDRMTDTEWRQRIGVWMSEEGTYNWNAVVEKPWWTASYRVEQDGYNAY